ncbi:hypothetical protein PO909_000491 [Leuciscus waleckii]
MNSLVNIKIFFSCETVSTLNTHMWLFSSVDRLVFGQMCFLNKTLPALITCERPLSSVNSHVNIKV